MNFILQNIRQFNILFKNILTILNEDFAQTLFIV